MPTVADARRWLVDQFSNEEIIQGSPKRSIRDISDNLLQMTTVERQRNLEHIKAYSDLYYQGRHKEAVPAEVRESLRNLERRTERLNAVDEARKVVEKYGGPPSRTTIEESLDRSYKERAKEFSKETAQTGSQEHIKQRSKTREHIAEM